MWAILAMQIVAVAIVVERIIALYIRRKIGELKYSQTFEAPIKRGQLKQASDLAMSEVDKHPLSRAVEAGVLAAMNLGGREEIKGKMDEVLLAENSKLDQRTAFLAMLANVGTLTGLLGTIVGMIKSFAAVTYANPMDKATLLSAGISEAMNTTAYGLIMAIPTIIMFAVLANRTNQLSDDLNQGALKVFNWLSYAFDPIPVRAARKSQKGSAPTLEA